MADRRRNALIKERGEPTLRLEFDIFDGNKVSMWTHLNHGSDFAAVKAAFVAARDHLDQFIRDGAMCPFAPHPDAQPKSADLPEPHDFCGGDGCNMCKAPDARTKKPTDGPEAFSRAIMATQPKEDHDAKPSPSRPRRNDHA